jgi:signal-transduction protein with cAMP-binding, CBS, and nucleotidyltransferase domain
MANARDLLQNKVKLPILSIAPDASAFDAMKMMAEYNVGALLVFNLDGSVAGILSERDFARKLEVLGRSAKDTQVREIMTDKVLYVESTQALEECMSLMSDMRIRHLPVFEDGKLIGLLSIRDVLREIITEQKSMISHLEHYILGGKQ